MKTQPKTSTSLSQTEFEMDVYSQKIVVNGEIYPDSNPSLMSFIQEQLDCDERTVLAIKDSYTQGLLKRDSELMRFFYCSPLINILSEIFDKDFVIAKEIRVKLQKSATSLLLVFEFHNIHAKAVECEINIKIPGEVHSVLRLKPDLSDFEYRNRTYQSHTGDAEYDDDTIFDLEKIILSPDTAEELTDYPPMISDQISRYKEEMEQGLLDRIHKIITCDFIWRSKQFEIPTVIKAFQRLGKNLIPQEEYSAIDKLTALLTMIPSSTEIDSKYSEQETEFYEALNTMAKAINYPTIEKTFHRLNFLSTDIDRLEQNAKDILASFSHIVSLPYLWRDPKTHEKQERIERITEIFRQIEHEDSLKQLTLLIASITTMLETAKNLTEDEKSFFKLFQQFQTSAEISQDNIDALQALEKRLSDKDAQQEDTFIYR